MLCMHACTLKLWQKYVCKTQGLIWGQLSEGRPVKFQQNYRASLPRLECVCDSLEISSKGRC